MRGNRVEGSIDLPVDLIQGVLRDNGRVKGIWCSTWASPRTEYSHATHIVWMKAPSGTRARCPRSCLPLCWMTPSSRFFWGCWRVSHRGALASACGALSPATGAVS